MVLLFIVLQGISIRLTNISNELRSSDGDIGNWFYQMIHYHKLVSSYNQKTKIKNICEIGFQLGVGAITLITSVRHNVSYYGFDYGKKYSKISYNIISKIFNLKMIWGNSKITISKFIKANPNFDGCDVIHIDGCHSQDGIYYDISNMKKISHTQSLILLDDVNINSKSVKNALRYSLIKKVTCFNWKPYCVAYFV